MKLGRALTQKGSLELVAYHVPVWVSKGLGGGRFVRVVGKYAFRLYRMENAVLTVEIDFNQGLQSGQVADDDTP